MYSIIKKCIGRREKKVDFQANITCMIQVHTEKIVLINYIFKIEISEGWKYEEKYVSYCSLLREYLH